MSEKKVASRQERLLFEKMIQNDRERPIQRNIPEPPMEEQNDQRYIRRTPINQEYPYDYNRNIINVEGNDNSNQVNQREEEYQPRKRAVPSQPRKFNIQRNIGKRDIVWEEKRRLKWGNKNEPNRNEYAYQKNNNGYRDNLRQNEYDYRAIPANQQNQGNMNQNDYRREQEQRVNNGYDERGQRTPIYDNRGSSSYETQQSQGAQGYYQQRKTSNIYEQNSQKNEVQRTPINYQNQPQRTPINYQNQPQRTPLNYPNQPQRTPINYQNQPQRPPNDYQNQPQRTPINYQNQPQRTPIIYQNQSQRTPINYQNQPQRTPINYQNQPQRTPINYQNQPQRTPINYQNQPTLRSPYNQQLQVNQRVAEYQTGMQQYPQQNTPYNQTPQMQIRTPYQNQYQQQNEQYQMNQEYTQPSSYNVRNQRTPFGDYKPTNTFNDRNQNYNINIPNRPPSRPFDNVSFKRNGTIPGYNNMY